MIKKIPLEHRILLLLNEQCDLSLVEISKTVGTCRQTASRKIKRLTEYGLIDVEHCKGPPPKYIISLTERGRQTALILSGLEDFRAEKVATIKKNNAIRMVMARSLSGSFHLRLKGLLS